MGRAKVMNDKINKVNSDMEYLSWNEVDKLIKIISHKIKEKNERYDSIIGIKNGGIIPARLISKELEISKIEFISTKENQSNKFWDCITNDKKYLLIDEIYDTGKTFLEIKNYLKNIEFNFACLISRYKLQDDKIIVGKILNNKKWIVFPWE
ncbi:MAG: phosphoribosyltransferase [Nitrososphaeraceae archaeon]